MKFPKTFLMKQRIIATALLLVLIVFFGVYLYKSTVEGFEGPVKLTYYFSPSCGYCKKFSEEPQPDTGKSIWDSFNEELKSNNINIDVRKVDISSPEGQKEAAALNPPISGVPCVIINKNGEETEFKDERTVPNLIAFVKAHL